MALTRYYFSAFNKKITNDQSCFDRALLIIFYLFA